MTKKIVVYKNDAKLIGHIVRLTSDKNVVVVSVDGKEYVGRLVNSWVEI